MEKVGRIDIKKAFALLLVCSALVVGGLNIYQEYESKSETLTITETTSPVYSVTPTQNGIIIQEVEPSKTTILRRGKT